nr:helix-turn-helix transcriptional regulator [Prauserella isguenensis]
MLAESTALLSAVGDGFELAKTRKRCARGGPVQYAIEGVEVGGGVHGSPTLSDSERKVVELAIAGRTNREISRTLYITVSTVEQHLTRVYRKFGISGRARLREVLDRKTGTGGMPVGT